MEGRKWISVLCEGTRKRVSFDATSHAATVHSAIHAALHIPLSSQISLSIPGLPDTVFAIDANLPDVEYAVEVSQSAASGALTTTKPRQRSALLMCASPATRIPRRKRALPPTDATVATLLLTAC